MLDLPELFDADPRNRWAAASALNAQAGPEVEREIKARFANWPKYWWGVINPWLVFVGPSPGNSHAKPVDWERERWPALGSVQVHFREHVDSGGFWDRMRAWTAAAYARAGIFPDDATAALGSALLANLVPEKQGDAKKIPAADLEHATPNAVALLLQLRPRVIVPMEKRIGRLLVQEFVNRGASVLNGPTRASVPAKNQTYPNYRPSVWQIETDVGPVTIAESPQHPSKHNFYDAAVVDSYLASVMREALPSTN